MSHSSPLALMVRRITSNATIESSDENESAAHGDDDARGSGSLTSSSSSDSENDGGFLGRAINDIIQGTLRKTMSKGKEKKARNAGGTNLKPSASECLPSMYMLPFSTVVSRNNLPATGDEQDGESAKKFTFNIAMFSAKEQSKDLKKRAGKNTYMVLDNNEPFDTWKAQLLVRIEKTLMPSTLDINNYEIHFTVARISPSPLMVASDEEYVNMLEWVGRSKNSSCNVYVQELYSSSKVDSPLFSSVICSTLAKFHSTETW